MNLSLEGATDGMFRALVTMSVKTQPKSQFLFVSLLTTSALKSKDYNIQS
jgi:hypothetical protein